MRVMKSTASITMRLRAWTSGLPNSSKSETRPPGPTPSMKRPLLMWSNWGASGGTIAGWWLGRLMTAVPNAMLLVRSSRPAKNISGEGIGSVVAEKCSPSHSSSKPSRSASTDFSLSSSSVLQNVRSGGCTGIMNIPRRMLDLAHRFLPPPWRAASIMRGPARAERNPELVSCHELSPHVACAHHAGDETMERSENEPAQIRVLGEIADVLVHVVGVDHHRLPGTVGGAEGDVVEHALHDRLQPARAD